MDDDETCQIWALGNFRYKLSDYEIDSGHMQFLGPMRFRKSRACKIWALRASLAGVFVMRGDFVILRLVEFGS